MHAPWQSRPADSPPCLWPTCAASKAALLAEIEGYIRATQASGSSQVTVIKSGYLQKRSQKSRNDYKRRFFVLDSQVGFCSTAVCWCGCWAGRIGCGIGMTA